MFGFYNLNKPVGPTSHDLVAGVRRLLGRGVKVGHAGTLDPFAGGVLVICVGPATRLADYVQGTAKHYTTQVTLGGTSDTDDRQGRITPTPSATPPSGDAVEAAISKFIGPIQQRPPAYSAIKADGRRAYKLARDGHPPELASREVHIHDLHLRSYTYPSLDLDITCGAGTYIRALARDIGEHLGVGGYCSELTRQALGPFTLTAAVDIGRLDPATDLIPPIVALPDMATCEVLPEAIIDLTHGKRLSFDVLHPPPDGADGRREVALLDVEGNLLALGESRRDAACVQPTKVFIRS